MQDPGTLLTARLREEGLRATPQRIVTYRALRRLNRHVTAEELLAAVAEDIPNMALPTVYATLEVLESLGLVRRVGTVGGTTLYDPVGKPHQHAVCSTCGAIEDLPVEFDLSMVQAAAAAIRFSARTLEVVVTGTCGRCSRR